MVVKDAATRAVRSLIQGTVAAVIVFTAALAARGGFAGAKSDLEVLLFAEALAGLHALITFGQNLTEDNTNVPTVK